MAGFFSASTGFLVVVIIPGDEVEEAGGEAGVDDVEGADGNVGGGGEGSRIGLLTGAFADGFASGGVSSVQPMTAKLSDAKTRIRSQKRMATS